MLIEVVVPLGDGLRDVDVDGDVDVPLPLPPPTPVEFGLPDLQ